MTYRERSSTSFRSLDASRVPAVVVELPVSWWKCRAKGVLRDCWKWLNDESDASDVVLGLNEIVGRLIERVANRFVGTCIARRVIVNPSIIKLLQVEPSKAVARDRERSVLKILAVSTQSDRGKDGAFRLF